MSNYQKFHSKSVRLYTLTLSPQLSSSTLPRFLYHSPSIRLTIATDLSKVLLYRDITISIYSSYSCRETTIMHIWGKSRKSKLNQTIYKLKKALGLSMTNLKFFVGLTFIRHISSSFFLSCQFMQMTLFLIKVQHYNKKMIWLQREQLQ